jgi:hypothetical protein
MSGLSGNGDYVRRLEDQLSDSNRRLAQALRRVAELTNGVVGSHDASDQSFLLDTSTRSETVSVTRGSSRGTRGGSVTSPSPVHHSVLSLPRSSSINADEPLT